MDHHHRRPVHPRARRRLARGRARRVRHPAPADRRADVPARVGRPGRPRARLVGRRGRARGHARRPVLPAPRRAEPALRRSRPAGRRSGSAASGRAASGSRLDWPTAGSWRPRPTSAWTSSRRAGTRSSRSSTSRPATRRPSPSPLRSRPVGRGDERALALDVGTTVRRARAPTTSSSGYRPALGPDGLAAVAATSPSRCATRSAEAEAGHGRAGLGGERRDHLTGGPTAADASSRPPESEPDVPPRPARSADAVFDSIQPRPGKAHALAADTGRSAALASPYPPGGMDPDPVPGSARIAAIFGSSSP